MEDRERRERPRWRPAEQQDDTGPTPASGPRLRRARLHHDGNVIELEPYRDAAERRARVAEARQVLNAGGALPVARRRTRTDERSAELLDHERARPSEETLMMGILERTMLDLRGRDRLRRAEAEDWLAAESRSHLFGFGTICDQLGREANEVRAALRGDGAEGGNGNE